MTLGDLHFNPDIQYFFLFLEINLITQIQMYVDGLALTNPLSQI